MFSPAVLVKHSTACFLFDICWCAYLMNKARLEQSYAEGWPQSGLSLARMEKAAPLVIAAGMWECLMESGVICAF